METVWTYEIGKPGDLLHGWYVRLDGGDFDPEEVRFHNVGNGPEPYYPDDICGPFTTQEDAVAHATGNAE